VVKVAAVAWAAAMTTMMMAMAMATMTLPAMMQTPARA
jgi:hypothetical protein